MKAYKYIILGAGPAGLAFAAKIQELGEKSFMVLEKEKEAGGLCRSVEVDGAPLDFGGGHFLDVRRQKVLDFLFRYMPKKEWNLYKRDSRIIFKDSLVNHPFEANIWQLSIDEQIEYLKSIAAAGCNNNGQKPEKFTDWIVWKLGDKVATDYMLPYNQKMFGETLDELGTYWLSKLPSVSFDQTLKSCLTHKPYGKQPGHAEFYYPKKYGYGEVWLRIAESLSSHMEYGANIKEINFDNHVIKTIDGDKYQAEKIITTIPWQEINSFLGMPKELENKIRLLKHTAVQIEYFNNELPLGNSSAQWIYEPDLKKAYHRILVRYNFCPNSRGYWTESRKERVNIGESMGAYRHMNEYAYPLNTINKPWIMHQLLDWAAAHDVYGLGRWGEHKHYNSDVTVELAMQKAEQIFKQT